MTEEQKERIDAILKEVFTQDSVEVVFAVGFTLLVNGLHNIEIIEHPNASEETVRKNIKDWFNFLESWTNLQIKTLEEGEPVVDERIE